MSSSEGKDNGPSEQRTSQPEKPGDAQHDPARSADRSYKRSFNQRVERLFEALGTADAPIKEQITHDLASLMPPRHRMSNAEEVTARLQAVLERDAKAPPPLLMKHTGAAIDVASETTARSIKQLEEFLGDGDERLLQAYVANERLRGVLAMQLAEHDALRAAMIAELAARYTKTEQWRYKLLPKVMFNVVAVLLAANLKRDALKPGTPLMNDIIDVVLRHCKDGTVTRDRLVAAARSAQEQFERPADKTEMRSVEESNTHDSKSAIAAAREKLGTLVTQGRREWGACRDEETKHAKRTAWLPYYSLEQIGGGIDENDRPVFESVDDFAEAMADAKAKPEFWKRLETYLALTRT